jgi:hypothetical protein
MVDTYAGHALLHAAHRDGGDGVLRLAAEHQGNQRLEALVAW